MSLDRHFTNHGHVHRFLVANADDGWEVREEEDSAVVRQAHRRDWHRVERDVLLFEIKALALKRDGWNEL